jgi:serine protease Do
VFGLSIIVVPEELRKQLGIKQGGVLVNAISAGPAANAGIRRGDIILQLDGVKIKGTKHFKELLTKQATSSYVSVLINRRGDPIFLALKK